MSPTIEEVLNIALQSECTRRKYGVIIADGAGVQSTGYNKRVGKCCSGICVRDRLTIKHGRNTDAGAEIHAEQAALINWQGQEHGLVYLAGLNSNGGLLQGFDSAPCYSCARMLRYAGFKFVFVPTGNNFWTPLDIASVMETWEQGWEDA